VSALNYEKYAGALKRYKASKKTKADQQLAIYDAIFQAAMWSLESNCKQDNNVYTACKELFFSHELNETEKLWLVVALSKARPDEFEVKLRSGKNSGLEIVKAPTPTGIDAAGLGWRKYGKPIPDSENSQSKNGFGAQLFFTEDQKFFDDWNKP